MLDWLDILETEALCPKLGWGVFSLAGVFFLPIWKVCLSVPVKADKPSNLKSSKA